MSGEHRGFFSRLLEEGNLRLDITRHQAFLGKNELRLTNTEFRVLRFLMENKGAVLSRTVLLDEIWGENYSFTTRAMDVCIARLREKIGRDAIETVRGIGYRLKYYELSEHSNKTRRP